MRRFQPQTEISVLECYPPTQQCRRKRVGRGLCSRKIRWVTLLTTPIFCICNINVPVSVVFMKSLRKIANYSIKTYITFMLFIENLSKAVKRDSSHCQVGNSSNIKDAGLRGLSPPKLS